MCDEQVNTLSFGEFIYLSNSKFSTMKECKKREVFNFFSTVGCVGVTCSGSRVRSTHSNAFLDAPKYIMKFFI